jgi:hypothetical protein
MSLANVVVPLEGFDRLYEHLVTYKPNKITYKNMHMREPRSGPDGNELRYLHAVRVRPGAVKAIDGMISGPGVLWAYELLRTRSQTQLVVSIDQADARARARIGRRFLQEIFDRVDEEQAPREHYPKLKRGQVYLRRRQPGMPVTDPVCRSVVGDGVLDDRFVSRILPWGFVLLRPS